MPLLRLIPLYVLQKLPLNEYMTKITKFAIFLVAFLLIESALFSQTNEALQTQKPDYVSLIELIANPEKYHGKIIRVKGFLRLEFEGNGIYLSKEDWKHGVTKNAFWVGFDHDYLKELKPRKISGNWVFLEGVFDKNDKGHGGLFSGKIRSITKVRIAK